ncbi:MAG: prepilin-type N-terminal cleavage/methylation domain-containing protein [Fibrobacter sp.]|nr:prepilin-type N-terminal cleavage/methylation domain-containing protein [Fibrobacter sp.]
MVFAKLVSRGAKSGYTLVEVLVVVIIMGVLSTMGVASLQRAVANARVKDAAVNTAAFVERVSNLSKQRNEVLCLRIDPGDCHKLLVVRDGDGKNCSGGSIDSLTIDPPNTFLDGKPKPAGCGPFACPSSMVNWLSNANNAPTKFDWKNIGLAATPNPMDDDKSGGICIQYGDSDVYGAVRKTKNKNWVVPMWKVGNDFTQNGNWSNWTEL